MDSAAPKDAAKPAPWRGKRRVAITDAKEKFIAVRCTQADRDRIGKAAGDKGLSVGAYLRALALGSAGARHVKRPRADREQLARLLSEIGKLGSNINQIAKWCNSVRSAPGARELDLMRGDIATMRAALMQALGRDEMSPEISQERGA